MKGRQSKLVVVRRNEHICSKCHSTADCLPLNVTGHREARPMQGRDVAVQTQRQRCRVRGFAGTRSPGVLGHVTQCPTSKKKVSNSIVRVIIMGTRVIVSRVAHHGSVWVQEQHHNQGEWVSASCQLAVAGKDAARRSGSMQLSFPLAATISMPSGHNIECFSAR